MREQDIAQALQRVAEKQIPDNTDLWPAIRARLQARSPAVSTPRPSAVWLAAATVFVLLLAGTLWASRAPGNRGQGPGAATAADPGPAGSTADWVAPEIYPDLATLSAAADIVVRGRATGPDQLAVSQVILNRAGIDPATLQLRLLQLPADAPALLNDPPLVPGQEYVLFLRSYWGLGSPNFLGGDHTFRPIGGPQGQWPVRAGAVTQQADVPLKSLDGQAVDVFVSAITAAPDPRPAVQTLFSRYGWTAGEPNTILLTTLQLADVLASDGDLQRWIEASRRIGLDWAPYAGRQVLSLVYNPGPPDLRVTVLVADGQPVGAWVRAGQHGLTFGLDQREDALAAAGDPDLRPTPTVDPNPIGERANLARHYRLGEAQDMWVKGGPVQGGLVRDDALRARLIAALDTEVAVERVSAEQVPPDDLQTVLVVFKFGDDLIALRYHLDQERIYTLERNVTFAPPAGLREALAPLIKIEPTVQAELEATETPAPAG